MRSATHPLAPTERQSLGDRGWALLEGIACDPDNRSLLQIASALGEVSMRSLPLRSGLVEPGGVQRVEALAEAPRDQFGQPLRSGHHTAFPLHSDEAFLERPCHYVLLHCWRSDPDGQGESLLAWRSAIEAAADLPTLQALRGHAFAYPGGESTTLAPGLLRYNRMEIEGHVLRSGRTLSAVDRDELDRLDRHFDSVALSLLPKRGDLLLIDNHRVLHGRTAFPQGSPRLFKRVRVEG